MSKVCCLIWWIYIRSCINYTITSKHCQNICCLWCLKNGYYSVSLLWNFILFERNLPLLNMSYFTPFYFWCFQVCSYHWLLISHFWQNFRLVVTIDHVIFTALNFVTWLHFRLVETADLVTFTALYFYKQQHICHVL